ncbi:hypothetical protein IU500_17475 [Nocardia terpenica]|uniref:hypothetical protein n=1 Tax=Nocardia terpenica TaxID=455432 RepID=UPI0018957F83|nr:hypothetical protein [Nocardia terpenica]MBF6063276.1 hypothetical protein [Nocardia terpenica]MBF6105832.1 hypothetical protein [Nocardia terpenica]MBF6113584.1 hypothetical protein [Nocardia terpenica]MBF6119573.1 hypothetical protein [Nocardia terpenica]MBF6151984.1 hypothetical protein [Nocardia terpenica]
MTEFFEEISRPAAEDARRAVQDAMAPAMSFRDEIEHPVGYDAAGNLVPAVDIQVFELQKARRGTDRQPTVERILGTFTTNRMAAPAMSASKQLRWGVTPPWGRRSQAFTKKSRMIHVNRMTRQDYIEVIGVRGDERLGGHETDLTEADRVVFRFTGGFEVRGEKLEAVLDLLADQGVRRISFESLRRVIECHGK